MADDRLDQLEDALGVAGFDLVDVVELLRVEAGAGCALAAAGQQRSALVEDAHRLRAHLGNARRDQVDDAGDLGPVEGAAGVQRQQHRGARLLLLAKEPVLVRQREVDARRLHGGERADRARQLAFEAALEGEALLELGLAEAGAVHQLEARDRALGQAGGRHLQAQVVNLCRGNEDGRAAFRHAIGHVHLRQLGDDGAAVLVGEVGVEHLVVAVRVPGRHREDDAGQGGEADQGADLAAQRQRLDSAAECRGGGQRGVGREGDGVVHGSCDSAGGDRPPVSSDYSERLVAGSVKQAGIAAPVRANAERPRPYDGAMGASPP